MNRPFLRIVATSLVAILATQSFAYSMPFPELRPAVVRPSCHRIGTEALSLHEKSFTHDGAPDRPALSALLKAFIAEHRNNEISDTAVGLGILAFSTIAFALVYFFPTWPQAATLGSLITGTSVGVLGFVKWVLSPRTVPEIPSGQAGQIYERLILGGGERNTDWYKLALAADVIVNLPAAGHSDVSVAPRIKRNDGFTVEQIQKPILDSLSAQGLGEFDNQEVARLLKRLMAAGILKTKARNLGYILSVDPAIVTTKLGLVESLTKELAAAIRSLTEGSDQALLKLLETHNAVTDRWRLYPVESRSTFLKAVALLDAKDQEHLIAYIENKPALRTRLRLVDSLWLMLTKKPQTRGPKNDWIEKHAPHLLGSTIWSVAAEGFYPAGGLGRVQQYHGAAMDLLAKGASSVAIVEAYYPDDYGYFPHDQPPPGIRLVHSFEVKIDDNRKVMADVYYREINGVKNYLIKDRGNWITKKRYAYGRDGTANYEDFAYFMARASAELIHRESEIKSRTSDTPPQYPAIIANDGQLGLLPRTIRKEFAHSPYLQNGVIMQVTHTYNNRGPAIGGYEVTSEGLAYADINATVSALHRDEVAPRDSGEREVAVTNGDDRVASRSSFLSIWKRLFGNRNDEHPEPEDVALLKRTAKAEIVIPEQDLIRSGITLKPGETALDPEKVVFGYFGRLVSEKAGLFKRLTKDGVKQALEYFFFHKRFPANPDTSAAFTEENLRFILRRGGQVVLYANQQPGEESAAYSDYLYQLAQHLNHEPETTGRLIVRTKWTLEDQRAMLTATDAQFQDSWRETEAAGYTESDASANGALQMGPPYLEGIIQRQGVMIDRTRPGVGNTLVPRDESEKAYQEVFGWVLDKFNDPTGQGRRDITHYQATSVRLSRPLEAIVTGAEYLRLLNQAFERKINPLEAVREWLAGEPEMVKHFRKPWVRQQLVAYLRTQAMADVATPMQGTGNRIQSFVITLPNERPFVIAIDTENVTWDPHSSDRKLPSHILYRGNEDAFRKLFGDSLDDDNAVFEVYDPGPNQNGVRQQYETKHFMDETKKNGWPIGLPYPGVQVLCPILLTEAVDRETAITPAKARGIPISVPVEETSVETAYLRDVPMAVSDAVQNDPAIHQALGYMFRKNPPQQSQGNRLIMQVPVRFLGGWGPHFLSRLRLMVSEIGLPPGNFVHLLAAYPDNYVGEALNRIDRPHDVIDHRSGEFYKVHYRNESDQETENFVIFRNPHPGRPGETASYFTTRQFLGNRTPLRQAIRGLHTLGQRAIIDATMHVSLDSPLVLEHPEFFRHDFSEPWDRQFHGPLEEYMKDSDILDRVRDYGFLVHALDDDGSLAQKLALIPGLSWGHTTINGKPAVRYLLRHHESDYGPMSDTVAFNPHHDGFRKWYVDTLSEGITDLDTDGYRFDLASRMPDEFWLFVKTELAAVAAKQNKSIAFIMEDLREATEQLAAHMAIMQKVSSERGGLQEFATTSLPIEPDLYHAKQPFEHLRDHREHGLAAVIDHMIQFWKQGGYLHYLTNHDEPTMVGLLGGDSQRNLYYALLAMVYLLPGSVMFPWWEAYGWALRDGGVAVDARREWTFERFLEFAHKEPKHVRRRFRQIMNIANQAIFRDSHEILDVPHRSRYDLNAYARVLRSPSGNEMSVVISNLDKLTISDTFHIPIDILGSESDNKVFLLYDHIHFKMSIYLGAQLRHLSLEIGPWESRVYGIREIENPSAQTMQLIDNNGQWPGQGIEAKTEQQIKDAYINGEIPAPWELQEQESPSTLIRAALASARDQLQKDTTGSRKRILDRLNDWGPAGTLDGVVIRHRLSGQVFLLLGPKTSGRAAVAEMFINGIAPNVLPGGWELLGHWSNIFVNPRNEPTQLFVIQDPAFDYAQLSRYSGYSETPDVFNIRPIIEPVQVNGLVWIDHRYETFTDKPDIWVATLNDGQKEKDDVFAQIQLALQVQNPMDAPVVARALKNSKIPVVIMRRAFSTLEKPDFQKMVLQLHDQLEQVISSKPAAAGAWGLWKSSGLSLWLIGAIEGLLTGVSAWRIGDILRGTGTLDSIHTAWFVTLMTAVSIAFYLGIRWMHQKFGVLQTNGQVSHDDKAVGAATRIASSSLLGIIPMTIGLIIGSGWLIAFGIVLGIAVHAIVNWLAKNDPDLTFLGRLIPARIAFHTRTLLVLAALSHLLFPSPAMPYMSPIQTGGNSLGIFYSPEQQLTLQPGHGNGDFGTSKDVVEAIADLGGDFFAFWPFMMTTVNGAPYSVLAPNILDPKKANIAAFVQEWETSQSGPLGAYQQWHENEQKAIEHTSKVRRMPHDDRLTLNGGALTALWTDLQSQKDSPMGTAFQKFRRYAKRNLDEEFTYVTLRNLRLAHDTNNPAPWDWTTWKKEGIYRSLAVWRVKRSAEFKADYEKQLFIQFIVYRQLDQLKKFGHSQGVEISVDKPVGMDGFTWNKKIFEVAEKANYRLESQGVKADYFEPFGQYWQFKLQRAKAFLSYHLDWITALINQGVNVLRIDHALGFFRIQHWVEDAKGALTWEKLGLWPAIQEKADVARKAWELGDHARVQQTANEVRELYFKKLLDYWDDARSLGMSKDAVQKIFKSRYSTELADDAQILVWRYSDEFDELVNRAKAALKDPENPDLDSLAQAFIGGPSLWTEKNQNDARKLAQYVGDELKAKGARRLDEVLNKGIRQAYLLGAPWTRQNVVQQQIHHGRWGAIYLRTTPTEVEENTWDTGWMENYLVQGKGPQATDSMRPAYYVLGPGGRAIAAIEALAQRIGVLIYYEFLGALKKEVDSFLEVLGISRLQPAIYYPFKKFGRRDIATYSLTDSHSIKKHWEEVLKEDEKRIKLQEGGIQATDENVKTLTPEVLFWLLSEPMQSDARGVMYTINDLLGLGEEVRMNEPGAQSGQFEAGIPMYVEHFKEAAKAYKEGKPIPMEVTISQEQDLQEYTFQVRSRQLAKEVVERMHQLRAIRPESGKLADTSKGPVLVDVVPSVGPKIIQLRVSPATGSTSFQMDATIDGQAAHVFFSIRDEQGKQIARAPMQPMTIERGVPNGRYVWRGQWPARRPGHYTFQIEVADKNGKVLYRSDFGHLELAPKNSDLNSLSAKFHYWTVDILRSMIAAVHERAVTLSLWRGESDRVIPKSPSDERYLPKYLQQMSA